MTYREPTPEELLSALEGKALPGDAHDAYLRLGRALGGAAPQVEEPDMFFASRLKAQLAAAPMPQPKVPIAALLLPLVGVFAVGAIVFFLPRQNPALPAAGDTARDTTLMEAAPKVAGLGGELTLAVGDVRWRATAADAWQAAAEGAQIAPGAELDVPGDGRAVVTLDDGSAVRLNGKTTLAFSAVTRDAVEIRESRGTAYYRVMKDPNRTFTVVTEEGTITALGTAFAVARDADKKTLDVNCIESKVKVALAKDGTKLEKELGQGKTLTYDGKKLPDAGTTESAIDPQKIAVVPFFAWNITEDAKEGAPLGIATEVKELAEASDSGDAEKVALLTQTEEPALAAVAQEPKPIPTPAPVTGITLSGVLSGTTAKFSWKVNGVDVSEGFKLVYNKTGSPVYPGDGASYQGADVRSASLPNMPAGKTMYFRICAYRGGSCTDYSNQVKLVVPAAEPTTGDVSLSLSGIVSGTTASLKWTATGDVSGGFKLVWNKTGSPVYPGDNATYVDGGTRAFTLKGLPENAVVYIRICRYTGSGCDAYSNEVKLQTGTGIVKTTGGYTLTGEQQLSVQQVPGGVQLNWTPCTAANFLYYKVVRSETNGDPYYPNDGYVTAISNQGATGYTDASAVSGKTYYYRICSKESDGTVWCGNVVKVTVQ